MRITGFLLTASLLSCVLWGTSAPAAVRTIQIVEQQKGANPAEAKTNMQPAKDDVGFNMAFGSFDPDKVVAHDKSVNSVDFYSAFSVEYAKNCCASPLKITITEAGIGAPVGDIRFMSTFNYVKLPGNWDITEQTDIVTGAGLSIILGETTFKSNTDLTPIKVKSAILSGITGPYELQEIYTLNYTMPKIGDKLEAYMTLVPIAVPMGGPEASTWVMMLLGFAGLSFVSYRASRKNAVFAA